MHVLLVVWIIWHFVSGAFHMRSILGRTCKIPFFSNVLSSDFQDGLRNVWNIPDDGRRSLRLLGRYVFVNA